MELLRSLRWSTAFITVVLGVGCSSSSVEVRRIYPSDSADDRLVINPNSVYGTIKRSIVRSATLIESGLIDIEQELAATNPEVFATAITESQSIRKKLAAIQAGPPAELQPERRADADVVLNQAEAQLGWYRSRIREAAVEVRNFNRVMGKIDVARDEKLKSTVNGVTAQLDAAEKQLRQTESEARVLIALASSGFGGFQKSGVAIIDPSDPMYRKLLGNGRARRSEDVLVSNRISGLGDSSLMIVQESPGYYRVYQVSNDPTQAVANVQLISRKALQAALKYAAPVAP